MHKSGRNRRQQIRIARGLIQSTLASWARTFWRISRPFNRSALGEHEMTAPQWDLTPWFEDFDSEYKDAISRCRVEMASLLKRIEAAAVLSDQSVSVWAAIFIDVEAMEVEFSHLATFANCRASADSNDAVAQANVGDILRLNTQVKAIRGHLQDTLNRSDDAVLERLFSEPELEDAQYMLSRLKLRAQRSMSSEQERLANDLAVDGLHAWGRLYDEITGSMTFDLNGESTPLAWRRSLLQDPHPQVRAATFRSSNQALERHGPTFASILNAIAGSRITTQTWRGGDDVLQNAIFEEGMSGDTLDAMLAAVRDHAFVAQRYLKIKARLLGSDTLSFAHVDAPLSRGEPARFTWDAAQALVLEAFDGYHPELRDFAQTMFDRRYIEADPRPGKRSGAYCTGSKKDGTSRIFMTYRETLGDVVTLAHELGHAYHSRVMRDQRKWACGYPASLAETASILAETLIGDHLLAQPDTSESLRMQVLSKRLSAAVAYLLNIPTRFYFEKAFYERRQQAALSADDLCRLMHETQLSVYGPVIDEDGTDPWFWASKLHFFLTGISFYNFPYTFGYLFSTGVLAEARRVGPAEFQPRLATLLRSTGSAPIEIVANESLGVDLTRPDFWTASLERIGADLEAFEALTS